VLAVGFRPGKYERSSRFRGLAPSRVGAGVKIGVAAEVAAVGFAHVVPPGVLGDESLGEKAPGVHLLYTAQMEISRTGVNAIEFHPGAGMGDLSMDVVVALILGMNSYAVLEQAFGLRESVEMLKVRRSGPHLHRETV